MLRTILLLIVSAHLFAGDLRVMCSPESMAANALKVTAVGTWDCYWLNGTAAAVKVPIQAMYLAMPTLHAIAPARAQILVNQANANSWRSRALRGLDYGSIIAIAVTGGGAVAASKLVVMGLGLASNLTAKVAANLNAQQPDLAAFTPNCPDVLNLDAGAGYTCTLYASKMKNVATIGPVILGSDPPTVTAPKSAMIPFLSLSDLWEVGL